MKRINTYKKFEANKHQMSDDVLGFINEVTQSIEDDNDVTVSIDTHQNQNFYINFRIESNITKGTDLVPFDPSKIIDDIQRLNTYLQSEGFTFEFLSYNITDRDATLYGHPQFQHEIRFRHERIINTQITWSIKSNQSKVYKPHWK